MQRAKGHPKHQGANRPFLLYTKELPAFHDACFTAVQGTVPCRGLASLAPCRPARSRSPQLPPCCLHPTLIPSQLSPMHAWLSFQAPPRYLLRLQQSRPLRVPAHLPRLPSHPRLPCLPALPALPAARRAAARPAAPGAPLLRPRHPHRQRAAGVPHVAQCRTRPLALGRPSVAGDAGESG